MHAGARPENDPPGAPGRLVRPGAPCGQVLTRTGMFSMLTLAFTLKYLETNKAVHVITALIMFFLAFLSKEITFVFIIIIP